MTSEELKNIIEERGLKKKALAAALRVSPSMLTKYLNGTNPVPWLAAFYIRAAICGIPVEEAKKME